MSRALLASTALLPACLLTAEGWFDARDRAVCDVRIACFGEAGDVASCAAAVADYEEAPCEDYDGGAAATCVAELRAQAADCPTDDPASWEVPAVCAAVCPGS